MVSEGYPAPFLSQVEASMTELERAVQGFEWAAADVEQLMEEAEQLADAESASGQFKLQALARALHASYNTIDRVQAINKELDLSLEQAESMALIRELADKNSLAPFPMGTLILGGRYRLLQLLARRPRVHLYLARRLSDSPLSKTNEQPLVAIREIVLAGLSSQLRQRIEQAAFAEFAAPRHFGSLYLPGAGDRIQVEHARQYLIVQPRHVRGRPTRPGLAATLAEFLADKDYEPNQLEMSTALHWGIQLCFAVARLHRMNIILGELTPEMIVVARSGRSVWGGPLLLPAWPPTATFWPGGNRQEARATYNFTFPPFARESTFEERCTHPFAAPETLEGRCDERSDVYALGAVLYLLLTRHAPAPAARRLRAEKGQGGRGFKAGLLRLLAAVPGNSQQFALTPPHLLNERISTLMEHIILRAMALNPEQRFASVMDLARTLESMKLKADTPAQTSSLALGPSALASLRPSGVSQMRKMLEKIKKELDE